MKKLTEIAQEWVSLINPAEELTEKILNRAATCDACPKKGYDSESRQFKCLECTCPLSSKVFSTRVDTTCPIGKW